jgi:L-ascorbate metabolism protein UlaG (beta-lactamase superfamily)
MAEANKVTIKWLGHSSFLISEEGGVKIVTDPFDKSVGYPMPDESADVCVISHDHFDHNCVSAIKGKPEVVKGTGERKVRGVKFHGVASFHDEQGGSQRGKNTIWTFELGGIRFAHAGDLGAKLDDSQKGEIGAVDVLLVPVGGYYTIDASTAAGVVKALNPKVVIPMHYKTSFMGENFPISRVDEFTRGKKNVIMVGSNSVSFTKETLPKETTVYVLEFKK